MELKYCWRCESEMPMLTDEEMSLCHSAIEGGKEFFDQELAKRNITNYESIGKVTFEKLRYFQEMYKLITGYTITNANAIWHHRINHYGPDCPNCKKPLRTALAKYCVACGFGKENMENDPRPLTEKRKELF